MNLNNVMLSRSPLGKTLRTQPPLLDDGGSKNSLPFGSKNWIGNGDSSSFLLPKSLFIAIAGFLLLFSLTVINEGGGLLESASISSACGGGQWVIADANLVGGSVVSRTMIWVPRVLMWSEEPGDPRNEYVLVRGQRSIDLVAGNRDGCRFGDWEEESSSLRLGVLWGCLISDVGYEVAMRPSGGVAGFVGTPLDGDGELLVFDVLHYRRLAWLRCTLRLGWILGRWAHLVRPIGVGSDGDGTLAMFPVFGLGGIFKFRSFSGHLIWT